MKNTMVAVVLMVVLGFTLEFSCTAVEVFQVGDSARWTTVGNPNYTAWSMSKTFDVGDILLFLYDNQSYNVLEVSRADYRECITSSPLETYTSGMDTIIIDRRGHHYFTSGFPGNCDSGMKLDVRLPKLGTNATSPSVSPSPSMASPSPSPSMDSPTPSPSMASPSPSPSMDSPTPSPSMDSPSPSPSMDSPTPSPSMDSPSPSPSMDSPTPSPSMASPSPSPSMDSPTPSPSMASLSPSPSMASPTPSVSPSPSTAASPSPALAPSTSTASPPLATFSAPYASIGWLVAVSAAAASAAFMAGL